MNKAILGSIIGTAALIASSGVALAHETLQLQGGGSAGIHVNDDGLQVGAAMTGGADVNHDGRMEAGTKVNAHATSTAGKPQEKGEKEGWDKSASSTHGEDGDKGDDHGQGFGKGGLPGFFRWLFGMSSSTTVGDIRAQMTATTTASTSHSEGLGFWARILGAFHFGGNKQ